MAETPSSTLIEDLNSVAEEMFEKWDKGMKAGKLLTHLEGRLAHYDPRISRIRDALAKVDAEAAAAAAAAETPCPNKGFTTADCVAFLQQRDSDLVMDVEGITDLKRRDWKRIGKWTDAEGRTCREFANTGVPVVILVVEEGTGPNGLSVLRERGLGMWEKQFSHFEDWYGSRESEAWQKNLLWPTLKSTDFLFGRSVDDGEATFFFQPKTVIRGEVWDQHLPIDHLFQAIGLDGGGEIAEATFSFSRDGTDGFDATDLLITAGFTHDPKLDNISGS